MPQLALLAFLLMLPATAAGQQVDRRLAIAPVLLRGEDATSVGVRWSIQQVVGGRFTHDTFPRRVEGRLTTRGAAAFDPTANPETIELGGEVGWFVALFKPPTDPDPTDPDAVPEGGFDYGSISVGAAAALESDQRFNEVNALLGGRFSYVNSRQDFPWPLLPALQLQLGAVVPLADGASYEIDSHARADVNAAWHLPLGRSPFVVHANLWYWNALGAADVAGADRTLDGIYGSVALAYELGAALSELVLHEVFVRWSSGEAPVRADDRTAWMIGVVVGR